MPHINPPTLEADLEESVAPSRPLTPELLWPSLQSTSDGRYTIVDSPTCPNERNVIEKRAKGNHRSPTFWESMLHVESIHILDRYFHPSAMERLYFTIKDNPVISSIHLLCGEKHIANSTFVKYKKKLQKKCEQKECIFKHKEHYQPRNFPYIHDRFVLADNELWHFGADVGGGYEGISAISRGWAGQAHDFKKIFDYAFHNTSV